MFDALEAPFSVEILWERRMQARWSLATMCDFEGLCLRALEPIAGHERMRERRGRTAGPIPRTAAGPARLCEALEIDRTFSGDDLTTRGRLWLAAPRAPVADDEVITGPRIGVEYAGPEWSTRPWRFGIAASPSLSRPFATAG